MFKISLIKIIFKFALFTAVAMLAGKYVQAEPLFQFQTLTKKDGLSSSVVYDVVQDKNGFIWFATEDGLQKYDGFELVTYRYNRIDKHSLSNNFVRSLLVDKSGDLWIGTENGVNVYQPDRDNFIHYKNVENGTNQINSNSIRSLYQTTDGLIWVGTIEGLNSIDTNTNIIKSYKHQKVRAIFEDNRRQLLIGTLRSGLYQFDRVNERFIDLNEIRHENKQTLDVLPDLSNESIIDIMQDSSGRIFIATWGSGIYHLQRDVRQSTKIDFNLPSQYVRSLYQDNDGQIWIGTKQGILLVEPTQNLERHILADERNAGSLVGDNILTLFQGQDETMWIGTYGGGVSRFFPASQRFETYGMHPSKKEGLIDPVVFALHENAKGDVWVGSETGKLALFDNFSKSFRHFELENDGVEKTFVIRSIYQTTENGLLVGTSEGLFSFDIESRQLKSFEYHHNDFLSGNQPVMFIEPDSQGRIFIGIDGKGLAVFSSDFKGNLTEIENLRIRSNVPRALVHSRGHDFYFAADGENIKKIKLITSEKGMTLDVSEIEETSQYSILDMDLDWNDRLWIGAWSSGIKVIANNKKIISIDESNGLPINSIYSVIADPLSQKIWVSSNLGLTAISPETFGILNFNAADGLQGDEFNPPGFRSSSGYIYFGGVNGFNRFYPSISSEEYHVRAPSMINLNIANENIEVKESTILEEAFLVTEKIVLKFDQTPFSFSFTSPQFVKPKKLRFRYRLLGLSERWIIATADDRKATYTNIGSGDYVFELQVGTDLNEWNNEVRRLAVRINPPWWASNSAFLVYLIVVLLILSLATKYVVQRRKKEKSVQLAIKENEERLKLSLWGSGYEFWDWNLNTGEISRSNEFKKIEIECPKLSRNLNELASYVHPNDLEVVREKLGNHIAGNSKHFDICYRIIDIQNGWRWIQDRGKVVARDAAGNALRMSGTQRDITNIREKDAQFEMLGQAFKSTSDGVWIRDHEWRLVECNPAFERMTGFSLNEKKGEALWFPDIQEQTSNLIQRIRISIEENGNWQGEAWAERKYNDPFPQKLSIDTLHDERGNIRYYVGVFSDITYHKRTEEEFRKLANYDSLTGLPNRACLYDRLNQTIEKAKRDKGRFALFLVDIDNFKRINDSLGHNVGDHLIKQVAARLVNCNKEGDTVARIGGDEFIIVVEKIVSSTSVATFSEMLLKELNQPIFVKGQKLKLNFSIGITLAPDDAMIAERLMRNADTAMNEAKKSVNNSYQFYSVEFNERARKRLALENALRKAIDDETLELFYQPKIDLKSGLVDGVEALARWTHKELGFISPVEFIPLAEETGLIIPLGHQILRMAIRQTKLWVDAGIMRGRTSINLSAHQFWNRNLAEEASQILSEEGLPAKYIELEITESACMQDILETKSQITTLKSLGFSLALDDFGTGYSSLAQLKSLPFDTLKVDKSFIDNIESNEQNAKVVKAIIDIAKSMEMEVVIEGVESKSQCEYLWKNRAFIVQGFFFSRPVRASILSELFLRRWHKQEYLGSHVSNVTHLG